MINDFFDIEWANPIEMKIMLDPNHEIAEKNPCKI